MSLALPNRDRVINEYSITYIKRPSVCLPIPGTLEAIAPLNRGRRYIATCSDQAGNAQGPFSQADLHATHGRMVATTARMGRRIDGICCCTRARDEHSPGDKPAPAGPRALSMRKLSRTPDVATVIGNSLRDIEAALTTGCLPPLVPTDNSVNNEMAASPLGVVGSFDGLLSAVDWLRTHC